MWTSPAADPGAVIHVEQPEATTDGAAGTAGAVTDTSGRLAAAPPAPVSHPVRPATTMAVVMLVSRRIRFCLRALGVTLMRHILNHARPPGCSTATGGNVDLDRRRNQPGHRHPARAGGHPVHARWIARAGLVRAAYDLG